MPTTDTAAVVTDPLQKHPLPSPNIHPCPLYAHCIGVANRCPIPCTFERVRLTRRVRPIALSASSVPNQPASSKGTHLASFVLGDLVGGVLAALLALAIGVPRLGNVDLFSPC